jgi:hypothetical protein
VQLIFYTGQDIPLTETPFDDSGDPISGGSVTVEVTVTDPTGTVSTSSANANGDGSYSTVVSSAATAGVWLARWVATGTNGSAEIVRWVYEDQFQVRPMGVEQLVDLASVKAHLGLNPNDTRKDAALQGFILAAADLARDFCGPFLPEVHTQWYDGGSSTLVLDWLPLLTVQSCTEYYGLSAFAITEQPLGGQMNAFGFTADYQTGQLTRRTFGGEAAYWARGAKNIKVVYTAGRAEDVPYTIRLGTLELIRHIWQLTQQGGRPQFGGSALDGADGPPVLTGFALPARVRELWAPLRRPPGIA